MWNILELSNEVGKLFLAAIIGGIIGLERETHGQAAGLRTNVLVCTGGCLLMMLSLHMVEIYQYLNVNESVVRLDPARIASYAIASMGFLGAGAIITGKGNVKGLTTAASMWLVTAIGMAIGAKYYAPAVASTCLSLIVLYGFRRIKRHLPTDEHTLLTIRFSQGQDLSDQIKSILHRRGITINFSNCHLDYMQHILTYRLRLQSRVDIPWMELAAEMKEIGQMKEIGWEEAAVP